MPTEINRTSGRKQIDIDGTKVNLPVIQDITFKDPVNRGQEKTFTFFNAPESNRQTRVEDVASLTNGDITVSSERITKLTVKDSVERGQEYEFGYSNDDPWPATSDGQQGNTQRKVHYLRYTADNTPTGVPWVDVEVVDQWQFKDAVDRGQQTLYTLTGNPPAGDPVDDPDDPYQPTFAECDMSLPLLDYSDTSIDPPYRLDPFRNIVNIGGGPPYWLLVSYNIVVTASGTGYAFLPGSSPLSPQVADVPVSSGLLSSFIGGFDLTWREAGATRIVSPDDTITLIGTTTDRETFAGNFAFSTQGPGSEWVVQQPNHKNSSWTFGADYVFKPGHANSSDSRSPYFVPPALGYDNWSDGGPYIITDKFGSDVVTGAPGDYYQFGSNGGVPGNFQFATATDTNPDAASIEHDVGVTAVGNLQGRIVDFVPVAASQTTPTDPITVLLLGTPRAPSP